MGRVTVTLNNRSYRLNCGDGEEHRISCLADHIRNKMDMIIGEFGQVGEERLLLMAALMVTDELFDLRDGLSARGEAETGNLASEAVTSIVEAESVASESIQAPAAEPAGVVEAAVEAQSTTEPDQNKQVPGGTRSSRFAKQALSSRKPSPTA